MHYMAFPSGSKASVIQMCPQYQNYAPNYESPRFQLYITAVQANTKVTVQVPPLKFKEEKTLQAGERVTISVPTGVEMYNSEKSFKTVRVEASSNVSVTSFNYKLYTADTAMIYPTTEWGTEYFIFTPSGSPYGSKKEFAVTNGKNKNQVEILPEASINFQGRVFKIGEKLVIDLEPYESVQLQSTGDLSGSRVSSQQPVAVFSGHTCTFHFTKCNHVYEQLLPVSRWGTSFILPALSFQNQYDSVYLQASQTTQVTVNNGKRNDDFRLSRGQMKEIKLTDPKSLFIQSDHGIQVLLLFNGVKNSWFLLYDPFLMTIMPRDRFCSSYSLEALENFDNKALIVVKTSATAKLRLDNGNLPQGIQWEKVAGTDFSWAEMSYKHIPGSSIHTVSSSGSSFGLYSIGVSQMNGYGSVGQCIEEGQDS
ncbi:hypothetical protein GOODEAATRI_030942, partial [Goodea atripinnis]